MRVGKFVGELGHILLVIEILFSHFGSCHHIKVGKLTPVPVTEPTNDINLPCGVISMSVGYVN